MPFLTTIVASLKKAYTGAPRFSVSFLKSFVPFLSWYVFVRGVLTLLGGLRSISWGFHSGRLPRLFSSLLDIHPVFYIIGGATAVVAGILYMKAYGALAQPARRALGWQQWTRAAALATLLRLYEVLVLSHSLFWFLVHTALGWYFIFEFGRLMAGRAAGNRAASTSKKRSRRR